MILDDILSQVNKLNHKEQAILLKKITAIIKKDEPASKPAQLTQLSGLGSSLWQGVDIDKYVDDERQW
jgi:hypothetical protein